MKRQTVGEITTNLSQKTPDSRDPIEVQRELQKDYMNNLIDAIDRGYKKYSGDYFVHVETKKESLLHHTYRNYFIDRKTCPTPNYDQSVYKYNRELGQVEYLWTIPDRETSHYLRYHALEVVPQERELLQFVLKFEDGTLLRLCKKLNGEKLLTTHLEKD